MYSGFLAAAGPITTAGIWVAAIGVVGILIRQLVPWLKLNNDADKNLIDLLMQRVQRLEEKVERYERKAERQERRHALEQRHANHKFRNVMAAFDATLMALKVSPEKTAKIVQEAMELRARQELAEAKEFEAISAAIMAVEAEEAVA